MYEKCKYAQLASFVDGEGTIGVHKVKHPKNYTYTQSLSVSNSDIRLISWIVDNFGGTFPTIHKYENKNGKMGINGNWAVKIHTC